MNILFFMYIFIYITYTIFGYNSVTKLLKGEKLNIINNNSKSSSFFIKRLLQLSLITLLVSSLIFINSDINLYVIVVALNVIVLIGYLIKFYPVKDPLTYLFHLIWALPIFLIPFFNKLQGNFNILYLLLILIFVFLYNNYLADYVYS